MFQCSMRCANGEPVVYRGSTPTLIYTTPFDAADVTKITASFEQRGEFVFSKDCEVTDQQATTTLTAEETEKFNESGLPLVNTQLVVELDSGETAISNIISFKVQRVIGADADA